MPRIQKIRIDKIKSIYGDPKSRVNKFCKKCGGFKHISEFNFWASSKDNLSPYCSKHPR